MPYQRFFPNDYKTWLLNLYYNGDKINDHYTKNIHNDISRGAMSGNLDSPMDFYWRFSNIGLG